MKNSKEYLETMIRSATFKVEDAQQDIEECKKRIVKAIENYDNSCTTADHIKVYADKLKEAEDSYRENARLKARLEELAKMMGDETKHLKKSIPVGEDWYCVKVDQEA